MSTIVSHFVCHLQEWKRIGYSIHLPSDRKELLRKSKQFVCQFCKWLSCLLGSFHSFMSENDSPQTLKRSFPMSLSPHKKRAALSPFSDVNVYQMKEKPHEESVIHSPIPSPQRFYRVRYVKCFNMAFEVFRNIKVTCSMSTNTTYAKYSIAGYFLKTGQVIVFCTKPYILMTLRIDTS